MFEPFLLFFTFRICSFFRVPDDLLVSPTYDHEQSEQGILYMTLESWDTAIITNSDNNSKPLPRQYAMLVNKKFHR